MIPTKSSICIYTARNGKILFFQNIYDSSCTFVIKCCVDRLGEAACVEMKRFVCVGVFRQTAALMQITPSSSFGHSTQMLIPSTHLTHLISRPRWLNTSAVSSCPAPRQNSGGDPAVHGAPGQDESDPLQDSSISLIERFKKTFKQYSKVMIPVHVVTSTVWFGTFYYAAMK